MVNPLLGALKYLKKCMLHDKFHAMLACALCSELGNTDFREGEGEHEGSEKRSAKGCEVGEGGEGKFEGLSQ